MPVDYAAHRTPWHLRLSPHRAQSSAPAHSGSLLVMSSDAAKSGTPTWGAPDLGGYGYMHG